MRYLKRKESALALMLLLVLALGIWFFREQRAKQNLEKFEALAKTAFSDQARKLPEPQRQELRTQMRGAMSQLTSAQRSEYFKAQRKKRTEEIKKTLQLPKAQRNAALDKDIRQSEERRRQMQQQGKAGGGPGPGGFGPPGGNGKGRPTDPAQREQRAKQRLDQTDPEERAVMSQYRQLMNERRGQFGLPPLGGRRP